MVETELNVAASDTAQRGDVSADMLVIHTLAEFQSWREGLAAGRTIGFTPTMGALHDGHLSHIHALKGTVDIIVASVFVNPAQFAEGEDLDKYPRDFEGDARKLQEAGCDVLFYPHKEEMYPDGYGTWVTVDGVTDRYEGAFRPEHFRGVATIVCKLLNIVRPHVMTLGQKDAQQVAVVRKMVRDLNVNTTVQIVDTMRDTDGVALSSRNMYLSPEERTEAASINRALVIGREALASGSSLSEAEAAMRAHLSEQFQVDYFDIIDADTFAPPEGADAELLGVFAGRIGATRLIDNMVLKQAG